LPVADPVRAAVSDPEKWFAESAQLAEQVVYAEPVKSGLQPYRLDRTYETNARDLARSQAAAAGARLAALLNAALQ
jgi:hypothetical protein